jgi:aryl sulfotransferase
MKSKRNLVWLASYPKSGNTWFRVFLSNLLREKDNDKVDINSGSFAPIASSRHNFEESLGIESSDLSNDEIDLIRPEFYRNLSLETGDTNKLYLKKHDAFTRNSNREWIIPCEVSFGAVYFIRNPLDVAVSYSHHINSTLDKAIEEMNNHKSSFCKSKYNLSTQLRQILLTWSEHVLSWINSPIDICILRYEDMNLNTFNTFKKAVDFLKLNKTDKEITDAIRRSSFDVLQKQELDKGFAEKPQTAKLFFRKGKVGDWRNHLTNEQVSRLLDRHSKVMEMFGYLKDGKPV